MKKKITNVNSCATPTHSNLLPTPSSKNQPNPNYPRKCKTAIENIVQQNYT